MPDCNSDAQCQSSNKQSSAGTTAESATTTILPGLFLGGRGVVPAADDPVRPTEATAGAHWFYRPLRHCEDIDGPANAPTLDDRLRECRARADATLPIASYQALNANNWHSKSESLNSLGVLLDGPQVHFAFDPYERRTRVKRRPLHPEPWVGPSESRKQSGKSEEGYGSCEASKRQRPETLSYYELPGCPISSPNKPMPFKRQRIRPSRRHCHAQAVGESPFTRLDLGPIDATKLQQSNARAAREKMLGGQVEIKLSAAREALRLDGLPRDCDDSGYIDVPPCLLSPLSPLESPLATDATLADTTTTPTTATTITPATPTAATPASDNNRETPKRKRQHLPALSSPDNALDLEGIATTTTGGGGVAATAVNRSIRACIGDDSIPLVRLITAREEWLEELKTDTGRASEFRECEQAQKRFQALGMQIVEAIVKLRWFGLGFVQKYAPDVVGLDGVVTKIPLLDYTHGGRNYLLKMVYDCNFLATAAADDDDETSAFSTRSSDITAALISPQQQQPQNSAACALNFRYNPLLLPRSSSLRDLDLLIFDQLKLQDPITHAWRAFSSEPSPHELRLVTLCAHILVEAQLSLGTTLVWEPLTGRFLGEPAKAVPPPPPRPPGEQQLAAWHKRRAFSKGCWVNILVAQEFNGGHHPTEEQEKQSLGPQAITLADPFTKARARKLLRIAQHEHALKEKADAEYTARCIASIAVLKRCFRQAARLRNARELRAAIAISRWIRAVYARREAVETVDGLRYQQDFRAMASWLTDAHAMALRLQCMMRASVARYKVQMMRELAAAHQIQRVMRGRHGRLKAMRERCTRSLQCRWRQVVAKRMLEHKRMTRDRNNAALAIQCSLRCALARALVTHVRHNACSTRLQAWTRGLLVRRHLARVRACEVIQGPWRCKLARERVKAARLAKCSAMRIQGWFHGRQWVQTLTQRLRVKRALPVKELVLFTEVERLQLRMAKIDSTLRAKRALMILNSNKRKAMAGAAAKSRKKAVFSALPASRVTERYTKRAAELPGDSQALRRERDDILMLVLSQQDKIEALQQAVERRVYLQSRLDRMRRLERTDVHRMKRLAMSTRLAQHRELGMRCKWFAAAQERHDQWTKQLRAEYLVEKRAKAHVIAHEAIQRATQRTRLVRLAQRLKRELLEANMQRQEGYEWVSMAAEDNYADHLRPYLAASRVKVIVPLEQTFALFDRDHSSHICAREFQNICFELGLEAPRAVAKLAFASASRAVVGPGSKSTGIGLTAFCIWWLCESHSEQVLAMLAGMSRLAKLRLHVVLTIRKGQRKARVKFSKVHRAGAKVTARVRLRVKILMMSKEERAEYERKLQLQRDKDNYAAEREAKLLEERAAKLIELAKKENQRPTEEEEDTGPRKRPPMSEEEKAERAAMFDAKFAESESKYNLMLAKQQAIDKAEEAAKAAARAAIEEKMKIVISEEEKERRRAEVQLKMDAALAAPAEEPVLEGKDAKRAQRRLEKEQQRRQRGAGGGGGGGGGGRTRPTSRAAGKRAAAKK